jgi:hypothetical protein
VTVTLFRPTPRQAAVLIVIALAAVGCGFYLRYHVIEQAAVGIACGASDQWICHIRRATIAAFTPQAFGFAALISALLNLWRPSLVLCALALISGGLGIVLYNVALSALAIALLTLSLARPAAAAE